MKTEKSISNTFKVFNNIVPLLTLCTTDSLKNISENSDLKEPEYEYMGHHMLIWYLSHCRATKVQTSLHKRADTLQHFPLAYKKRGHR